MPFEIACFLSFSLLDRALLVKCDSNIRFLAIAASNLAQTPHQHKGRLREIGIDTERGSHTAKVSSYAKNLVDTTNRFVTDSEGGMLSGGYQA